MLHVRQPDGSSRSVYFTNAWLDAALIGGLSIVVFVVLRFLFDGTSRPSAVIETATTLSLFINYPHFSATIYRLYQSPDNIRQFPVTALAVPVLIVAAVAASVWQADYVAPYFITLFLIWSPFHYSGQTIGITMVYARRAKFDIGRWERFALSTFVYCTFLISFTHAHGTRATNAYGITIPIIHVPAWFDAIAIAVMCVGAAAFLYFVAAWARKHQRLPPPIILLPAFTQFVWFFPATQSKIFYEFIPMWHSLQYLYIAWAMQIGVRSSAPSGARPVGSILSESLRWGVSNYVGGMLLFIALPWMLAWVNVPFITSAGVVIAAVNIHHFFVDGVIWKLRNVRAASPLLMNIADWAPQPALMRA
jgi:hypothetical protein